MQPSASITSELKDLLNRQRRHAAYGALVLACLLAVVILASVSIGRADLGPGQVLSIVLGKVTGQEHYLTGIKESSAAIVWNIRLPRAMTALAVGAALAVAGTIFQAVLMNPLADSFTMGVSPGAALGASLALFFNMFFHTDWPVSVFAFVGAVGALLAVLALARAGGVLSPSNLIISGIIISSVFTAAISFIKSLSGEQVAAIVNWLIGSLAARNWEQAGTVWLLILPVLIGASLFAGDLNLLALGDRESKNLGLNPARSRRWFLLAAAFLTAAAVSVSGIIGFIGLIAPHILRLFFGSDNRTLVPLAALGGAVLLAAADLAGRTLVAVEVPVGVLTTLLGGPFFFYIFRQRAKQMG